MMEMPEITGPMAALMAGLVTSLHCAGMCGPLACAACAGPCGKASQSAAFLYHGSRLVAYTITGAVAGAIGVGISEALLGGATRGMAWVFILFFAAVVLGLDKRLRLPAPGRLLSKVFAAGGTRVGGRATALGFFTPLLPCVPLYLVVAAAALAGSAAKGAILLAAFGLGTVPLILLMQNRYGWMQQKFTPQTMDYLRRGLAFASIVLLVSRGTFTASTGCPMCH